MSDTPLLVPMTLEALLVNKIVADTVSFRRWSTDYTRLKDRLDPVSDPLSSTTPPEHGVHLRWVLPRALTYTEAKPDGTTEFPRVPNRWLVVRFDAPSDAQRATKAWIIESDYNGPSGSSPFIDETSGRVMMIGRSVEIEKWNETGGGLMLRATGAADLTFAAYQPAMRDVFSFVDTTAPSVPVNTSLTYLVTGWYSDVKADPLNGVTTPAQLAERLGARRWTLDDRGDALPDHTVLHAMTHQLVWTTGMPEGGERDAKGAFVSVGQTSIDALAGYVANRATADADVLEQWLQAFQYDLLDTLETGDGRAQLELRMRDAWFGTFPGGTTWHIVAARGEGGNTPPPPTEAQKTALAALNVKQRRLDETARMAMSLQQELHDLMWKRDRLTRMPASEKDQLDEEFGITAGALAARIVQALDATDPAGIVTRLKTALSDIKALADELPRPSDEASIIKYAKQTLLLNAAQHLLEPHTLPPFRHPVDPVVLLANIPMPQQPADPLPCRLASQTTIGVKFNRDSATVEIRNDTRNIPQVMPRIATQALPPAVITATNALVTEAFFVDAADASSIVRNGLENGREQDITTLRNAMNAQTAQIASIARPLAASHAFTKWKQAWSPLYLVWSLKWFSPTAKDPTGPSIPPEAGNDWRRNRGLLMAQDDWPFDYTPWPLDTGDRVRARGSEYFTWNADAPAAHQVYSGRSVITPQASRLLIDRIDAYLVTHPGDVNMKRVRELLGASPFISQALGGLNDELIARQRHQSPPPQDDPLAPLVGDEYQTVPFASKGNLSPRDKRIDPTFFPIRGGFFWFEQLMLVDAFGQTIDLMKANGNAGGAASFKPYRGRGLAPQKAFPDRDRMVQLAPRIVQPSRLDMRLVSARDDQQELDLAPNVNPICGWMLLNLLDESIELYNPAGRAFGSILPSGTFENPDIVWERAPGSDAAADSPANIENGHVRALVQALFAQQTAAARRAAFDSLKETIDKRLWTIDPMSERPSFASLFGRPLALVRARVRMQLAGLPAANQSWRTTPVFITNNKAQWTESARQIAQFTQFDIPIRLGTEELFDDGLIGYYAGTDYQRINVVHTPTRHVSGYTRPIGKDNLLTIKPGEAKWLTLLADPRAEVHATTGLLPTTWMSVPDEFINVALREIAVHFRVGPVMTERDPVRLPRPTEQNGRWLWIRRSSTGDTWDRNAPLWHDEKARMPERPERLIDAWLQFTPKAK